MKTILIAPHHANLEMVPAEIEAVVQMLDAYPVLGAVDVARFFREMAGGRWELIWIASHGSDDGVQLTDAIIDGDTMSAALRGTNARLIVLNTCSSERAAEQIYAATSIPIVCNIGPVPDVAALATAQNFARKIANGLDVARAFEEAKTRTFRLIPDNLAMYSRNSADVDDIRLRMENIERQQKDHHDLLYGRPDQEGLISVLNRLASRMGELRLVLWVMVILSAAIVTTLAFIVSAIWGGTI